MATIEPEMDSLLYIYIPETFIYLYVICIFILFSTFFMYIVLNNSHYGLST